MTAKQYLMQVQAYEYKIKLKIDQIIEERSKAEKCSAVLSERVQTSICGDSLSSIIAKIYDYEKELNILIDKQIDIKRNIISKLDLMMDDRYIEILDRKYLKGHNLIKIAYEMGYSYAQVKRFHGRALQKFGDLLKDEPQ